MLSDGVEGTLVAGLVLGIDRLAGRSAWPNAGAARMTSISIAAAVAQPARFGEFAPTIAVGFAVTIPIDAIGNESFVMRKRVVAGWIMQQARRVRKHQLQHWIRHAADCVITGTNRREFHVKGAPIASFVVKSPASHALNLSP